jgi:hypothetical protein
VKHAKVGQRRRRRMQVLLLATPLGILASSALVWQSSYSAFTATTDNTGNTFSTGTVALPVSSSVSATVPVL